MQSKGLKRLVFIVVFLIPVGWYLFLQVFGENKYSLADPVAISSCGSFSKTVAVYRADSTDLPKQNQLRRVTYGAAQREVDLIKNHQLFECLASESDLLLINEKGLWGSYSLERDGVDQFFTELDILKVQESYGEGVSR